VNACVLDTDVLIGALDRADAHHAKARRLLVRLIEEDTLLQVSSINYAEVLVRPAEDEELLSQAVTAIASLGISVHSPDGAIARDAARLRGLGISLADGFALATASGLDGEIASFDGRVRRAAAQAGVSVAK
jgi:predicted nucleic acid-binding protein